ncbi:DUF805 domain-containing protein [Thaumasiovibrio subtropicus]|uniref:DUF805 domain-containing protein n=1 Tax=Thaumasiovibrio subtropicus TaxID=1891207 RepID=UPI00131D81AD|nr:DUF805 domain-containing protein [Thaumasiovibrio subtropicus]
MDLYLMAWLKSFHFTGRTRRDDFYMFSVIHLTFYMILAQFWILGAVYLCLSIPAMFAILVRRLHDTGHSGNWMMLIAIPVLFLMIPNQSTSGMPFLMLTVGTIWLVLLLCMDSDPNENAYGISPKYHSINF